MIYGERLFLRCLEKEDIYSIKNWRNDSDIFVNIFSHTFINNVQQEKWFQNYSEDSSRQLFVICLKEPSELIGFIGLSNIDLINQTAELNTIIGEKKYWNQGFATEAMKLLLTYAFNELNLNRIYSHTFKYNEAIQRKNLKNGFKHEGLLRQMIYKKGTFQDVVVMGLLKKDWLNQNDIH